MLSVSLASYLASSLAYGNGGSHAPGASAGSARSSPCSYHPQPERCWTILTVTLMAIKDRRALLTSESIVYTRADHGQRLPSIGMPLCP